MSFADTIHEKPWLVPVGIGVVGGGALLLLHRGSSTPAVAPVVQGTPTTSQGADMVANQLGQQLSDALSQQGAAQNQTLGQLAQSQQQGFAGVLAAMQQLFQGIGQGIGQAPPASAPPPVSVPPPATTIPPTTSPVSSPGAALSLIQQLRQQFAAAFASLSKPASFTQSLGGNGYRDPTTGVWWFGETGHFLAHGFQAYYLQNGGAPAFGAPLSEEFRNSQGIVTQVFQRGVMEWFPGTDPAHYDVRFIPATA